MNATTLLDAELAYRRALAMSEGFREARNQLIREALAAGWTQAAIAEATGLTRGRINQLRETSPA